MSVELANCLNVGRRQIADDPQRLVFSRLGLLGVKIDQQNQIRGLGFEGRLDRMMQLWRDRRGAALIEYALLIGLITLIVLGSIVAVRQWANGVLANFAL